MQEYKMGKANYKNSMQLKYLSQFIKHLIPMKRQIIIVCIGTDRSTGDSLGPLVGTLIRQQNLKDIAVYGTLDQPVHAQNLEKVIQHIQQSEEDPYIIGIDSCLGRKTSVGMIYVDNRPIKPGTSVNQRLSSIGDLGITGIVNVATNRDYLVLQNTRLNIVINMATVIAECLTNALREPELLEAQ